MKRVKLEYIPMAVPSEPVEKTIVPSEHIEALNRSIRQKIRQNETERAASMEIAGRYMVK